MGAAFDLAAYGRFGAMESFGSHGLRLGGFSIAPSVL